MRILKTSEFDKKKYKQSKKKNKHTKVTYKKKEFQ